MKRTDKKKFIIRNPQAIDWHFYQSFDVDFLYNKAQTLMVVDHEKDAFKEFVEKIGGDVSELDKKYYEAMRAEIYFTELHQFEVLFALMIAIYQDLPHWLFLTKYKTQELKEKIQAFLDGDLTKLSMNKADNNLTFLNQAIYSGFMTQDEEKKSKWNDSLSNINWILRRIAEKYMKGAEYNAYKHGLRVMTGHFKLVMHQDNEPEKATCLADAENSITFLELQDKGEGGLTVYQTTKTFNPIESINNLVVMKLILTTIKNTRFARIQKKSGVELHTFFELDKDKFMNVWESTSYSFTM